MEAKTPKISLQDFLKRYTPISQKFIDEYLSFSEKCNDNRFGIEIEEVMNYLGVTSRDQFKKRLRNNYKENIDYIEETTSTRTNNEPRVKIFVSFDTFQELCMDSRTKKSGPVKKYYVTIHKFIEYYRQEISENVMEHIVKGKGYMYVIVFDEQNELFKMGRSSEDIRARLKLYKTHRGNIPDVKFLMLVENPLTIENCTKSLLEKFQYRGGEEIFQVNSEAIKEAIFDCVIASDRVNEISKLKKLDTYIVFDDKKLKTRIKKTSSKKASKKKVKGTNETLRKENEELKKRLALLEDKNV
jgi:phage anti-repressor protein